MSKYHSRSFYPWKFRFEHKEIIFELYEPSCLSIDLYRDYEAGSYSRAVLHSNFNSCFDVVVIWNPFFEEKSGWFNPRMQKVVERWNWLSNEPELYGYHKLRENYSVNFLEVDFWNVYLEMLEC